MALGGVAWSVAAGGQQLGFCIPRGTSQNELKGVLSLFRRFDFNQVV